MLQIDGPGCIHNRQMLHQYLGPLGKRVASIYTIDVQSDLNLANMEAIPTHPRCYLRTKPSLCVLYGSEHCLACIGGLVRRL